MPGETKSWQLETKVDIAKKQDINWRWKSGKEPED